MGLDQYLTANIYIGRYAKEPEKRWELQELIKDFFEIPGLKATSLELDIAYWRKSNQVHKWFVDNCQDGNDDCGNYSVETEQIQELIDLCKLVLKTAKTEKTDKIYGGTKWENGVRSDIMVDGFVITNPEEIAELLPTEGGFFFGGTGYDSYYLEDIEYTKNVLEAGLKLIKELHEKFPDFWASFEYRSSW